jgi:hypothetical protein
MCGAGDAGLKSPLLFMAKLLDSLVKSIRRFRDFTVIVNRVVGLLEQRLLFAVEK